MKGERGGWKGWKMVRGMTRIVLSLLWMIDCPLPTLYCGSVYRYQLLSLLFPFVTFFTRRLIVAGQAACCLSVASSSFLTFSFQLLWAEVVKQSFYHGPLIANPQMLWFTPLLQIHKLLRYASQQIANPQLFKINAKFSNPQISTKYCTTLTHCSIICYICKDKNYVFAGLRKFSILKSQKKIRSANRKSAKCHICGRSTNLTNYLSPQNCRFAICRTYLWTAHLSIL